MSQGVPQRAIIRPPGKGFGTIGSVGPRLSKLLATYQAGSPDGEPMQIEGHWVTGSDVAGTLIGNGGMPFYLFAQLEVSLANITYVERFPWPCAGWRRRVTATQVKVSAFNISGTNEGDPEFVWTVGASVQLGWTPDQKLGATIIPTTDGAYLRVPRATSAFQAGWISGGGLVSFGADDNPNIIASGAAGSAGAPSAPGFWLPVTQFGAHTPWPAFASVLWYRQPVAGETCYFGFDC